MLWSYFLEVTYNVVVGKCKSLCSLVAANSSEDHSEEDYILFMQELFTTYMYPSNASNLNQSVVEKLFPFVKLVSSFRGL